MQTLAQRIPHWNLIAGPEGLYIGVDSDFLNGTEHQKLKFLPITADAIARPDSPSLPTILINNNENALEGVSFDGSNLDAALARFSLLILVTLLIHPTLLLLVELRARRYAFS